MGQIGDGSFFALFRGQKKNRPQFAPISLVVVGKVVQDAEGAVELFHEDEADHLVGECHLGQRQFSRNACVDIG